MSELTQNTNVSVPAESQPSQINNTSEDASQNANQVNILDVDITDENVALNLLVNFVNIAQKRGVYSLPEASKIWECIRKFQKQSQQKL